MVGLKTFLIKKDELLCVNVLKGTDGKPVKY